jgi:hypothetical protein
MYGNCSGTGIVWCGADAGGHQLHAVALNEGLRRKQALWRSSGRARLESLVLAPGRSSAGDATLRSRLAAAVSAPGDAPRATDR